MSEHCSIPHLTSNLGKLNLRHLDTQLIRARRSRAQTVNLPKADPTDLSRSVTLYNSDCNDTLKQSTASMSISRENFLAPVKEEVHYYDAVANRLQDLQNTKKRKRGRRGGQKLNKRLNRLKKSENKKFKRVVQDIIYKDIASKMKTNKNDPENNSAKPRHCKCVLF